MPAKTPKMQRFMAMCAHNPSKAKDKCPSKSVSKEFSYKPSGGYKTEKRDRRDVHYY
jgi:hypothetical protein